MRICGEPNGYVLDWKAVGPPGKAEHCFLIMLETAQYASLIYSQLLRILLSFEVKEMAILDCLHVSCNILFGT